MKRRCIYYRVSIFALGSMGGGCWEDDVIVVNSNAELAYSKALDYVKSKGFAYSCKIERCDRRGDPLE